MRSSPIHPRRPISRSRSTGPRRFFSVLLIAAALAGLATAPVFSAAGELDCTFNGTGTKVQSFSSGTDQADDIVVLADGRIVTLTSNESSPPSGEIRFSRFQADGSLDTTFGGGTGTVVVTIPGLTFGDFGFVSNFLHFVRDSTGRYLVVGSVVVGTDRKVFVGRFTAAGALDTSFNAGAGFTTFDWTAASTNNSVAFDAGTAIAVDATNRPIVAGTVDANGPTFNPSDANFAFARLTTGGALDATFGTGGITIVSSPGTTNDDTLRDMKLDPTGRIVAVGDADPNLTNARDAIIVRLTNGGVLDTTFDGDGIRVLDLTQTGASDTTGDDVAQRLAFTTDVPAKIMIAGFAPQTLAIARLTDAGALDLPFGGDGIVNYDFEAGSQNILEHLFVQSDGKLLVTGWIPFDFSVMRINSDGTLDTTWAGDGRQTVNVLNLDRAYAAALMADGRVVLAGGTGNDTDMALARFLGDSSTVTGSTTAITSDLPDPSISGLAFTVAIDVQPTSGSIAPTGNVTVGDGVQSTSCTLVPPGSGTTSTASCSLALTTLGSRNLTASFPGNAGQICPSTSPTAPHTVITNASTTTIVSDTPDPSVVGQSVAVAYSVSALAGTPTGNVTVSDGTTSCTGSVAAGTCSLAFPTPGTRTLTATYPGDGTVPGSASGGEPHAVNQAATTIAITNDTPDPSVVGQTVTVQYSVAVASGSGTPTGTVTVSDGVDSCSASVAAGQCALALTTVGTRTLVPTYGGDTNFSGSTSIGVVHTVNQAATTISITNDAPDPSVVGQTVTVQYSVAVASGSGTPTGTVSVSDGVDSCSGTVAAGQCAIVLTTPGSRTLAPTYGGDTSFTGSTSIGVAHTVNLASTTTTITSDAPDPSVVGESVTVQYSVAVNAPGSGTPTGTVTVSAGVDSCSAAVAAGQCSLALTTAGSRVLTASYAGDTSFSGSTSAGESHTVAQGQTTITIDTDNPDPSSVNQAVLVIWTLTPTAPAAGVPTGTVTISVVGGSETCSEPALTGDCSLTLTTAGPHTLVATYSGDASFLGSTDTETHQVVAGASTTTLTASTPNPSVTGQPITASFTVTSASGSPTGSVTVGDGHGGSCTGTLVAGAGSCTFAPASAGALTLTADYSGDGSIAASEGTAPHTVNPAPTTLVLQGIAPEPSAPGQNANIAFALTVGAPGAGTPTGTVTITSGALSCTAPVANAVCSIAWPAEGTYAVTAAYAGDADFASSATAAAIDHRVASAASVAEVPTLGEWGLVALAAALASAASRRLRRHRVDSGKT